MTLYIYTGISYTFVYKFQGYICCNQDLQALTLGGRRRELNVSYAAPANPRPKAQEVLRVSRKGRGPASGRQVPEEDIVPAPKAYADGRRPCVRPRIQPEHPDREPRPIPGGWAGPTTTE